MGNADIVGDVHGRLIVFDLDGTLVDSRRDLADSANELITRLGGAAMREEAIGRMVGEGVRLLIARALRAARLDAEAEGERLERNVAAFLEIYDGRLLRHTRPYPGIQEVLSTARAHARLAVLTNKPARPTVAVLDGLELTAYFDDVIAGDGKWPRKPDPSGLVHLMTQAGAPPGGTLLVGDSLVDFETAQRAGVRCCLATYGFGYLTFPVERLTGRECLASTPSALAPILEAIGHQ